MASNLADLDDTALTELRRRKIGFVFQFFNLIPVLQRRRKCCACPCCWTG